MSHAINSGEQPLVAGDEIDVVALLKTAWSYRWVIGGIVSIFVLGSVVFALTSPPVYRAEVVVTQAADSRIGGGGSLANQLSGFASLAGVQLGAGDSSVQQAQAILRSRRLIEEFIKRNDLVSELLSQSKKPLTLWAAVQQFQGDVLELREDARKGTTRIAIDWTDPTTAARWANEFVALANEVIRTRALDEATRNIAYLNDQISKTNVIELRRVMYDLIQSETKTLMLANGRLEYAFTVVDPAVPPELRLRPQRKLIVLAGFGLGLIVALLSVFTYHAFRRRS